MSSQEISLQLLNRLVPRELCSHVAIELWDGTLWPDTQPRRTRVVLKHAGALRTIFASGTERGMGEGFLRDEFDIVGEIEDVLFLADQLGLNRLNAAQKAKVALQLLRLPKGDTTLKPRAPAALSGAAHSIERNKQAVAYHYNASNDFYRLWLDSQMVYSCAYFEDDSQTLDEAQTQKLDLICRKLRLQPGQRLLDLGCGWGALIVHAAKHFGVDATGITLSEPQVEEANRRIGEAGLENNCRVQLKDYREIDARAEYDALSSVGMFEHVGADLLEEYFERALEHLKPGGVFLNHGIAYNATRAAPTKGNFIDTYVFPDGETVPLNLTLQSAEEIGFEVRDVESLREHYALTLRHWVRNLENHHSEALGCVDEATYRVWRLYMASSAYGFSTNRVTIFQTLLAKPDARGQMNLPLTRRDWFK